MPLISIVVATLVFFGSIANPVQVPFLSDVVLVPKSNSTSVILTNRSCDQCLCESNSSHSILNCFPNNTCQLFVDAPRTYTLQSRPDALLYFPRQILPNASQCCMPNGTDLLNRLRNATPINASINGPRRLVMDNHGYLVTLSYWGRTIVRFHPNNLTLIDQSPSSILTDSPLTLAYHNEAYYVGFSNYILVVHSNNMTVMHNITASAMNGAWDIIFLNGGQQMIVTAYDSNRLVLFNRSSPTSRDYDYIGYQNVSFRGPHGLFYMHDSLFYVTSLPTNTVYKYSKSENATAWSETLAVTASPVVPVDHGNHVTIDDCDRYWLSLGRAGVQILDSHGLLVGSFHPTGSDPFDTLILDNYVVYFSEFFGNRIMRLNLTT